ncbi:MAG: type I methionyl aminopeptidase [Desulfovibrio sp.]|nr:type I methionyl aminopeptidase [Desulfovibrio sp.]
MQKFRGIFLKNENELALMREANRIGVSILDAICSEVRPGVATIRFEEIAQDLCRACHVQPAFHGYDGFPFAVCCSVNEEVVHGFPSATRLLHEGDIVSFDFGVIYEGFYSDCARTLGVGEISGQARRLIRVTEECLALGIAEARPGRYLHDISRSVQIHAEKNGYAVIKRFVGHGVGRKLHEKPEIPNFEASRLYPLPLKAGMVLAIEPMLALGTCEVEILPDTWTAVTKDRKLAAHCEHSVAVTSRGPEILSLPAGKGYGAV